MAIEANFTANSTTSMQQSAQVQVKLNELEAELEFLLSHEKIKLDDLKAFLAKNVVGVKPSAHELPDQSYLKKDKSSDKESSIANPAIELLKILMNSSENTKPTLTAKLRLLARYMLLKERMVPGITQFIPQPYPIFQNDSKTHVYQKILEDVKWLGLDFRKEREFKLDVSKRLASACCNREKSRRTAALPVFNPISELSNLSFFSDSRLIYSPEHKRKSDSFMPAFISPYFTEITNSGNERSNDSHTDQAIKLPKNLVYSNDLWNMQSIFGKSDSSNVIPNTPLSQTWKISWNPRLDSWLKHAVNCVYDSQIDKNTDWELVAEVWIANCGIGRGLISMSSAGSTAEPSKIMNISTNGKSLSHSMMLSSLSVGPKMTSRIARECKSRWHILKSSINSKDGSSSKEAAGSVQKNKNSQNNNSSSSLLSNSTGENWWWSNGLNAGLSDSVVKEDALEPHLKLKPDYNHHRNKLNSLFSLPVNESLKSALALRTTNGVISTSDGLISSQNSHNQQNNQQPFMHQLCQYKAKGLEDIVKEVKKRRKISHDSSQPTSPSNQSQQPLKIPTQSHASHTAVALKAGVDIEESKNPGTWKSPLELNERKWKKANQAQQSQMQSRLSQPSTSTNGLDNLANAGALPAGSRVPISSSPQMTMNQVQVRKYLQRGGPGASYNQQSESYQQQQQQQHHARSNSNSAPKQTLPSSNLVGKVQVSQLPPHVAQRLLLIQQQQQHIQRTRAPTSSNLSESYNLQSMTPEMMRALEESKRNHSMLVGNIMHQQKLKQSQPVNQQGGENTAENASSDQSDASASNSGNNMMNMVKSSPRNGGPSFKS